MNWTGGEYVVVKQVVDIFNVSAVKKFDLI